MSGVLTENTKTAQPSPSDGRIARTVLIFAYECAPYNSNESTMAAQRPAQFAKYLPDFGWRAIVLCCDAANRGRRWTASDRGRVLSTLIHSDPSASVIVATPSLPGTGVQAAVWRALAEGRVSRLKSLGRRLLTAHQLLYGDHSRFWQPCAREAASIIAARTHVDICIGEHSPGAGIVLANWFSRKFRVPWIADFRDPLLLGFRPSVRPMLAPLARRLLRHASHTVNVTEPWVADDELLFRRPATLVPNGFDPEDFQSPAPPRSREEFRIVYTGSVWLPDALRLFLLGLAQLRGRVANEAQFGRIRFVYRGGASKLVRDIAAQTDLEGSVNCAPQVPHNEAIDLIRSAHLLLLLSPSRLEQQDPYLSPGVWPGKSFEYIASGRPIVCVPGDEGILDGLLKDVGAGVSLSSANAISNHIGTVFARWSQSGDIPPLDNALTVQRFSRRAGAQKISKVLDALTLQGSANPPVLPTRGE